MFLRGALGIAAAGLASAAGLPIAHADPSPSWIELADEANWQRLAKEIAGRVVRSDDEDYSSAKQIFNTQFDEEQPVAVVQVANADDVAAAVAFAAANDLRIAARSGGHSYAGVSSATGVMIIDLRNLNNITYADGQVTVEPGLVLYDVYQALDPYEQTLPTGMCPSVGIAGLTLGGGLGFESRRYGMTCDRLIGANLVLPNGTKVEVSETSHPDLLWGLRGGGHFLGIVTSFTYKTCPATPKDLVRLTFPGDRAADGIRGWQRWVTKAPREQWADFSVDCDGNGSLDCWTQLVCAPGTGAAAAAEFTAAVGMLPLSVEIRALSHMETILALAGGSSTQSRASFTNGSDVVTTLNDEVIGVIIASLTKFSQAGNTGWVQINTLDGAVRDTPLDAAAFPWRNHAALVEWGAYEPIPPDVARAWVVDSHEMIKSASAGGYVNYLEPGDPMQRYFGDNYTRLDTIRSIVDPTYRVYSALDG